mmetsp:Transcript_11430/g.21280  ORF Transcript_11430/g.21280 Transcript_11430/m.21280 type:complete len:134 (+) Transcript_11430:209-610(+)
MTPNHKQNHLHKQHEHTADDPGNDPSNIRSISIMTPSTSIDVPVPIEESGKQTPREEIHEYPETDGGHDHIQSDGGGVHHALGGDVVVFEGAYVFEVGGESFVGFFFVEESEVLHSFLEIGGGGGKFFGGIVG